MPHAPTNGITTHYQQSGHGEPIVLIHGHAASLHMWKYQVSALTTAGFQVVRYDVRGHGNSDAPAAGYTWEDYSADLRDLVKRLGISRTHIAGLSMGGGIALQFALDNPLSVASLTLADSALPGFTYSEEFSKDIESLVDAVRTEGPQSAFERLWLRHPFFDGVRRYPDRFSLLRKIVLSYKALDYRQDAVPPDYRPAVSDRLAEITAPALVIVGEHDVPDFQHIAEILASNLPNARLLAITDCWHLPPLEQPDAFNTTLINFLHEVSGVVKG